MPAPIGSEIARRHPERYVGLQITDALRERGDCPICGVAGGDCARRHHIMGERMRDATAVEGEEVGLRPPVRTDLLGVPLAVVTERVVESVPSPGGGPDLSVVRHSEGDLVALDHAVAEGLPHRPATDADLRQ